MDHSTYGFQEYIKWSKKLISLLMLREVQWYSETPIFGLETFLQIWFVIEYHVCKWGPKTLHYEDSNKFYKKICDIY